MNRLLSFNDDCLIALLKEGRNDAFDEIYRRYHKAIYQNVIKLVKDKTASEDLVQDTFIAFWQNRNIIVSGRSLPGWLFVISYNLSVNLLKRKLTDAKAVSYLANLNGGLVDVTDNYEAQMNVIEKAILLLPQQQKRVLELCKLQGQSYKAAAREMKISSHTIKEYLTIAMKSIRKYATTEYKLLIFVLFFRL